jgi:hypothetical protein
LASSSAISFSSVPLLGLVGRFGEQLSPALVSDAREIKEKGRARRPV